MAFRDVTPQRDIENLFEDEPRNRNVRAAPTQTDAPRKGFSASFSLPALNLDSLTYILEAGLAVALIWFGATLSGSWYGPFAGKLSGLLAVIFYQYQFGTIIIAIGCILGYDAIKRFF